MHNVNYYGILLSENNACMHMKYVTAKLKFIQTVLILDCIW